MPENNLNPGKYFVGLMSGTSMDAIDAVLMRWHPNNTPELLESLAYPWDEGIKTRLSRLNTDGTCTLKELGELDILCGRQFATAVTQLLIKAIVPASDIAAIGSHGQTVFHHPNGNVPFSMQIGDPNTLAQQTGIRVVADFRRRDMAAGGQGAPLVPAFHQAVFQHPEHHRVILNIGGIANISILPANGKGSAGFDTGPGNCLMDRWIQKTLGRKYDGNGQWASSGKVSNSLLKRLLADDYFSRPPPKSTGTEYFSLSWLEKQLEGLDHLSPEDVQATLLQCSCDSIGNAIQKWAAETREVLVCGGGAHNSKLIGSLAAQLGEIRVTSTLNSQPAIDPDWVEALAFAWLAMKTLDHQPGNIPAVTGASEEVILGGVYPPPLIKQES